MKIILFFLMLSTLGWIHPGNMLHDIHLSKCLLEVNESDEAVQISMHIFIDDLEEALRRQGADNLYICTEKEAEEAETHIFDYLQAQFRIELDGQEKAYEFIGKEPSEDLMGVWCYLEIPGVKSVQEIKITHSLLLDIYDDQKNIMSVQGPGGKKGYVVFHKKHTSEKVSF